MGTRPCAPPRVGLLPEKQASSVAALRAAALSSRALPGLYACVCRSAAEDCICACRPGDGDETREDDDGDDGLGDWIVVRRRVAAPLGPLANPNPLSSVLKIVWGFFDGG